MAHRKIRIKDWGKPRALKSFRKFLRSPDWSILRLILILGVLVIVFFAFRLFGGLIQNQIFQNLVSKLSKMNQSANQPLATNVQVAPQIATGKTPIYFSFSDLFSGTGWLNAASTTMYQDKKETAFLLPPVFGWQKIDGPVSEVGFVNRASDGSLTKCIAQDCLMVVNNDLFFNGIKVINPKEFTGNTISNVSIGALSTKWMVGIVVSQGGSYEGHVFIFDGKDFSEVLPDGNLFTSQYAGVFGFGGSDDEWLAVYGAYQGKAYRFSKAGNSYQIQDISRFFDIRVAAGGFEPSVIGPVLVNSGLGPIENWYVWSLSRNSPTLIKVFGQSGNNLTGAIDFRDEILPGAPISALFKFNSHSSNSIILDALVTDESGNQAIYQFSDFGFERSKKYIIVSSNVSSYPWPVSSLKISSAGFDLNEARVDFFVKANNGDWLSVVPDSNVFLNQNNAGLFWMAEVQPGGTTWLSPFFDYIRIDMEITPT